ncbi:Transcriptional regulatory protein [Yarrowia sp. C11]|nr:Transcriptional regulatory protein [Yarrowia sp. C11]
MTTNDDDMVTSPLSELDSEAMLDLQQHDDETGDVADLNDTDTNTDTNTTTNTNTNESKTPTSASSKDTTSTGPTSAGEAESAESADLVGSVALKTDLVDSDMAAVAPEVSDDTPLPMSNGRKASLLNPADLSDDSSELSELEDSEAETERLYLNDLVDEEEESFKRRRESSSEDHIRQMKREREEEDSRGSKRARVNGAAEETHSDDNEEDTTARMDVDTTAKAEEDGPDAEPITAETIASALKDGAPPLPLPVEDAKPDSNHVADGEADGEAGSKEDESKDTETADDSKETKDMPTPIHQTEPSDNEHEDDKEEVTKDEKEDNEEEEDEDKEEEGDGEGDDAEDRDKEDSPADADKVDMRPAAMTSLAEIEVDFAKLRDFMFKEKMAAFEVEMGLCVKGTHPELHAVYEHISKMREDKIKLAKTRRKYKLQCINNQTRASRVQIHQQFLKDQGDARSGLLLKTTEEWYRVNRERRAMDLMVPDYGYTIPESKSEQIHQRNAQVNEISLLSGISKYVGFPAAPVISQATEDETAEDLTALGLQRPPVPHATFPVPPGIMQPMGVQPQPLQQVPQQQVPPPQAAQPQVHQQQQQQTPQQQHQVPPPPPHQQQHQPHQPTPPPMGQHRLNGHDQQHMPLPLGAPLMMQHPMYHQVPPIYGGYQYPAVPYYQGGNLLPPPQTMYGHPQMYGQVLPPPYMYQKREEEHE